jgi:hypothetical protein
MWLVGIYLPSSDIWVGSVYRESDVKIFFFFGDIKVSKVNNKESYNPDCMIQCKNVYYLYYLLKCFSYKFKVLDN